MPLPRLARALHLVIPMALVMGLGALSACVEDIGCASAADCPDGMVCDGICLGQHGVPPITDPLIPDPVTHIEGPASTRVLVRSAGGPIVVDRPAGATGVGTVTAPVGVTVVVDDTAIAIDTVDAIEADVVVTFDDDVRATILLRTPDWQDEARAQRHVVTLQGIAFAASAAGDPLWVDASLAGGAIDDAAFFDPAGTRLGAVFEAGGAFVDRPTDAALIVYTDLIDPDVVDPSPAPSFVGCTVQPDTALDGATFGELSVLVQGIGDGRVEELVAISGDAGTIAISADDTAVHVDVATDGGGGIIAVDTVANTTPIPVDGAWHRVSLRGTLGNTGVIDVDGFGGTAAALPAIGPTLSVSQSPLVSAVRVCGLRSVGATFLEQDSRNGHVALAPPTVLAAQPVVLTPGAPTPVDLQPVASVVTVVVRSDVPTVVTGLGLVFFPLPFSVDGLDVFVAGGTPDAAQPLAVTGVLAPVEALVLQVENGLAPALLDDAVAIDATQLTAGIGNLVVVVGSGEGALLSSAPVAAISGIGWAAMAMTPTSVGEGVRLPFAGGTKGVGALTFAPLPR